MQYYRYLISQGFRFVFANIFSAYQYLSAVNIVQTAYQAYKAGFSASGAPYYANGFTGVYFQRNIVESIFSASLLASVFIGKTNVSELNASVFDIRIGVNRVGKVGFLIKHLAYSSCAGKAHGDHYKYH